MPEPRKTTARKAAPRKTTASKAAAPSPRQTARAEEAERLERARERVISGQANAEDAAEARYLDDPVVRAATQARNEIVLGKLQQQLDKVQGERHPNFRHDETYVVTLDGINADIARNAAIRRGAIKRGAQAEDPRMYVILRGEPEARERQQIYTRGDGWTEQVVQAALLPVSAAVEVLKTLEAEQPDGSSRQVYSLVPFDQLFRNAQDLDEVQALAATLVADLPEGELGGLGWLDVYGLTVGQVEQLKVIVDAMRAQRKPKRTDPVSPSKPDPDVQAILDRAARSEAT